MDCRGRRGRRGRVHSCNSTCALYSSGQSSKPWSFLSSCYSFIILSSLIGIIYLMLDYHCNSCNSKCDLNSINKSIEDIAKNLAIMRNSYHDLEMKISGFSHDLPKIEGQIEILEALANAIEGKEPIWDARLQNSLPHIDSFIFKKPLIDLRSNATKCPCLKHSSKNILRSRN